MGEPILALAGIPVESGNLSGEELVDYMARVFQPETPSEDSQ